MKNLTKTNTISVRNVARHCDECRSAVADLRLLGGYLVMSQTGCVWHTDDEVFIADEKKLHAENLSDIYC